MLRFNPAVSVVDTATGVLLRSDLEAFRLEGEDARAFCRDVIPLLDGTRSMEELCAELSNYTPESVTAFIQVLTQRGIVDDKPAAQVRGAGDRWSGQIKFFRGWTDDPSKYQARLRESRVLVVGLEGWAFAAAVELAAAGLETIHLADDRLITPEDLLYLRGVEDSDVGSSRRDVLARVLREIAPWCRVTTSGLELEDREWNLSLVGAPASDLQVLMRVARFAQDSRISTLFGSMEELYAVVGPLVVPGETACWNCYRLRALGTSMHPAEDRAEQHEFLRRRPAARSRAYLAPMVSQVGHLLALESLKVLTGYVPSGLGGRVLRQHLVSLETSLHTVIRLPWCEVCGGAAPHLAAPVQRVSGEGEPDKEPRSLAECSDPVELRKLLSGWVDPHTGIIQHLAVGPGGATDPDLPFVASAILSRSPDSCVHYEAEIGSGKGLTRTAAMIGAVGEALERYSASRYRAVDLVRKPMAELDGEAFNPADLCLYTPAQYQTQDFPFHPYAADQPIHWVRGSWVDSGAPVWLPALPTYLNFQPAESERYCQVTTSGLAAGSSYEDALVRAICELAERDAFMLTWLARCPARRIHLDGGFSAELVEVLRQLEVLGAKVRLYLLDAGLPVSTVMAVGFGDGVQWPGATVALGAHWDPRIAVRKAVLEQGHVGPYIRRLMLSGAHPVPANPELVRTLIDHALYYTSPARQLEFEFLEDGLAPVHWSDLVAPPAQAASELAERFLASGVRLAAANLTSPDVSEGPFRVVRVLGTHAQQIHFGFQFARLDSPRLRTLTDSPNLAPHPLA
jgi:ribosomal protein S12 methylthiotransferase accessory factor